METPKAAAEAAAEPKTRSFFFYGTLMGPWLLSRIISGASTCHRGRDPEPEPEQTATYLRDQRMHKATLFGYERRCVREMHFPAVVPCPGASVEGFLVEGVTDVEAERLDCYEEGMYYSATVKVAMGWGLDGEGKDGEGEEKEEKEKEWRSAVVYVWGLGVDELVHTKDFVWTLGYGVAYSEDDEHY